LAATTHIQKHPASEVFIDLTSKLNMYMANIEQAADDLFFKLRNRFPKITLGDGNGNSTTSPKEARFFSFYYEQDEVKFGNITASLIDNESLKVYFHQDITKYMDAEEKQTWYNFLRELRKFAKSHLLGLDVRDISKQNLTHEDLKFVSNQNKEKSQIGESKVLWARRGKVSEGNLNNVKIHVVHSERMDENTNNRLLKVDRIFLVNENGERFLLPFKSVMAAKAMANHVGRGGTPYDNSGRLISDSVMEMTNLRRFASATRRKTFESEDAHKVIEAAAAIKESIKRSLFRMANNSRFDENMEDLDKIMAEQTEVEDIKPMFVQQVYNENLDNWMTSAAKAYKQYQGNIMEALKESAGAVAAKLKDPSWKMVLKDDPSEDRIITTSKYSDGRALLRRVLGTIADRIGMDDSEIANWASQIGQDIEDGKASGEDMQIALKLAKRYQDDLKQIMSNPDAAKELRVSAFGQRKNLYGKIKGESEEFESWVGGLGEDEPEISHPMQGGQGILSAPNKVAKTKHRLGSHEYTAITQQDNDGDLYFFIRDAQGNSVYYATEMDDTGVTEVDYDNLGKVISNKIMADHRKATDQQFLDDEDYMDETVERVEENEEEMMDEIAADEQGMDMAVEAEGEEMEEDSGFNQAMAGEFKRILGDLGYFGGAEKDKQTWTMLLNKAIEMSKTSNDPRGLERQIRSMIERSVNIGDRNNDNIYDRVSSAFMTRSDELANRTATQQSIMAHQKAQQTESEDDQGLPNKPEWEYDREGDMAKDQLTSIVRDAEELEKVLSDTENLPEWIQEKLARIKGMMQGVNDYMLTQHERGDEKRNGDDMEEGNEFSGALAKAKASHQDEFEVDGKTYPVKETMSRAAKGYEKYGKEGMQALAKAGKEGKDLDKIRDKYNKYDESIEVNKMNDSLTLMKKLAGLG
jgi:hypothetical protein